MTTMPMEYWNAYHFHGGGQPLYGGYGYSTATHMRSMGDYGEPFLPSVPGTSGTVLTKANYGSAVAKSQWEGHTTAKDATTHDQQFSRESEEVIIQESTEKSCDTDVYSIDGDSDSELQPVSPVKQPPRGYSVKIINPSKKSEYKTVKLQGQPKYCETLAELKEFITVSLPESLEHATLDDIGYVEPGHGAKGKRCWLHTDADIKEMYKQHKGKKELLLWCYSVNPASKESAFAQSGRKVGKSSVYNNHTKKMSEVDDIAKKLEEKHHGQYTPEQIRAWAHMVHMSKHVSYDEPPDKPFFRGRKRPGSPSSAPERKRPATAGVSPARKVNMRSELIDQLQKWHNLREIGAISPKQYEELQQTILTDIKTL